VAIRLSCRLENRNPGVVPALGVALTSRRDVLFFAFVNCKHRRRNFAAYRKHHSRSEGRDCKIKPGGPVVGGYAYKGAESSTKEHSTTETHNVSGGQEKNRSGTAGTVGKNQGREEGVVRYFEVSGATALFIAAWNLIRAAKRLGCEVSSSQDTSRRPCNDGTL
jgi:hypothetical protein